jgi:hypothetical protein
LWWNEKDISSEDKSIEPSYENPNWEIFLKDGEYTIINVNTNVAELEYGTPPYIIVTNDSQYEVTLTFGIPNGKEGDPGDTIIPFAYATNSPYGSPATVTNNLDGLTNFFYFGIPEGKPGEPGAPGIGLLPKGEYDPEAEYIQKDIVRWGTGSQSGQYYVWPELENAISNIPPSDTNYWKVFVKDGSVEIAGATLIRENGVDKDGVLNLDTNTLVITNSGADRYLTVVGGPGGGGGSGALSNQIDVAVTIGQYRPGNTISAGTDFETIFKRMLTTRKNPTAPTFSIALQNFVHDSYKIEYGYQVENNAAISVTYNKHDAGDTTAFKWSIGSSTHNEENIVNPIENIASIFNNISTGTYSSIAISATVYYDRGEQVDPDYDDSYIPAGNKSQTITLLPTRYVYHAPLASYAPTADFTPEQILALATKPNGGKFLANKSGTRQYTIVCPIDSVQATIALPMEIVPNGLTKAVFQSKSGSMVIEQEVTSEMESKEVSGVMPETGNQGNTSAANANKYMVYTYRSNTPFDNEVSIIITY